MCEYTIIIRSLTHSISNTVKIFGEDELALYQTLFSVGVGAHKISQILYTLRLRRRIYD